MSRTDLSAAARELFASLTVPGAGESLGREGWLDVLSATQSVLNVLAACQAVAMAQVSAFDTDDPVGMGEVRHFGIGHAAMEAPDLVAARIGCSAQAAGTRVATAVDQVTTMPALVQAMADGRLDGFRAAVVADELADAPAETRGEVVERLAADGRLAAEPAGALRRTARRVLGIVAPEVLWARAADESGRRGLHRHTSQLGVDHWEAWLPVESSRPAWAAVTALAQQRLRDDRASTLAQARADALTDLVLGRTTTSIVLHPTVPLAALGDTRTHGLEDEGADADELVPVTGYGTPGETFVRRRHLRELASLVGRRRPGAPRNAGAPAGPGIRHDGQVGEQAGRELASRRTRVTIGEAVGLDAGTGAAVCAVDMDRLLAHVPSTPTYRPSAQVERFVKLRDGRCRFPGCAVPVRFVDLDHVEAYDHDDPDRGGATAPANLACLCRRHHRLKQRQGWAAALHADGTMTWTDPTGRVRTSWPEDQRSPTRHELGVGVAALRPAPALPPDPVPDPEPSQRVQPAPLPGSWEARRRVAELEPYSTLEDGLADLVDAWPMPAGPSPHRTSQRPSRRRERRAAAGARGISRDHAHGSTPTRRIVLHAETVAELETGARQRRAPPF